MFPEDLNPQNLISIIYHQSEKVENNVFAQSCNDCVPTGLRRTTLCVKECVCLGVSSMLTIWTSAGKRSWSRPVLLPLERCVSFVTSVGLFMHKTVHTAGLNALQVCFLKSDFHTIDSQSSRTGQCKQTNKTTTKQLDLCSVAEDEQSSKL